MKLRSTPAQKRGRDSTLFPRLHKSFKEREFPLSYHIKKGPKFTTIIVDYFFVPHDIRRNLQRLHRQYGRWVVGLPGHQKKKHLYACDFHDYTNVEVLTEHAAWWIELFESAASLVVDCYSLMEEDRKEDYREEQEKYQAQQDAKSRANEIRILARMTRYKSRGTAKDATEAGQRLAVFAQDHPEEWAILDFPQKVAKVTAFREQILEEHAFARLFDGTPPPLVSPPTLPVSQTQVLIAPLPQQPFTQTHTKGDTDMVKLFQEATKFAVQTNIQDEREFTTEFAAAVAELISHAAFGQDELAWQLNGWMTPFVEICCKLRGYKSATREERLITAGEIPPQVSTLVVSMDDQRKIETPKPINGTASL